jgi:rhodanese-related sulfurtransferase
MQESGAVYLDVRSRAEYEQGHPAGAVNVPLLDRDDETGQMQPNLDFTRIVQANFPPATTLLIGCQMGGRSARAAQILETFGFTNVSNVKGGFGGARDVLGRQIDPGWVESGLPVEIEAPAGKSYADLVAKTDAES